MFEDLTDKNIDLYMMKLYNNPQCVDLDEYYDDVVNEKIKVHYDWKQLLGMKE